MMTQYALASSSCGMERSGIPMTSLNASAAAFRRAGASDAADARAALRAKVASRRSFIELPPEVAFLMISYNKDSRICLTRTRRKRYLRSLTGHDAGDLGLAHAIHAID